jgi:F-type H+-transporting ATPase subunit delta
MSVETIARRYALALADVVAKTGNAETIKTELKSWEDLINASIELRSLDNPTIDHRLKENVLEELIARTRPTKTTANFLRVLVRNRRLGALPEINSRFEHELETRTGNVQVKVTSARELNESEKSELMKTLAKLTGKQIKPAYNIDAGMIGGVVTQIGSTIYDGSVRTKLKNLREELING